MTIQTMKILRWIDEREMNASEVVGRFFPNFMDSNAKVWWEVITSSELVAKNVSCFAWQTAASIDDALLPLIFKIISLRKFEWSSHVEYLFSFLCISMHTHQENSEKSERNLWTKWKKINLVIRYVCIPTSFIRLNETIMVCDQSPKYLQCVFRSVGTPCINRLVFVSVFHPSSAELVDLYTLQASRMHSPVEIESQLSIRFDDTASGTFTFKILFTHLILLSLVFINIHFHKTTVN